MHCREDLYAVVVPKGYFYSLEVTDETSTVKGQKWKILSEEVRHGVQGSKLTRYELRFAGHQYKRDAKGVQLEP